MIIKHTTKIEYGQKVKCPYCITELFRSEGPIHFCKTCERVFIFVMNYWLYELEPDSIKEKGK